MSIDFSSVDFTQEEPSQLEINASKQAEIDAVVADSNKRLRIELAKVTDTKLVMDAKAPRVAVNPVAQVQYDCRLYALSNIIRNPMLSLSRTALADSWKTLYTDIPYAEKATNWNLSKKHKDILKDLLKEEGLYKYKALNSVADIIAMVKVQYLEKLAVEQANIIDAQAAKLKAYEFMHDDTLDTILYKGYSLKYSARNRGYSVTIGGKILIIPKGGFTKLRDVFTTIDLVG